MNILSDIESQITQSIQILAPRYGFTNDSLNVDVRPSPISDDIEIRVYTYCNNEPVYTTIRLSPYMLRQSAMGTAPMIIEHLDQGIRSLKDHILSSCTRRPRDYVVQYQPIVREPVGDPAPAQVPQTPYRSTPIVSNDGGEKIKEFKEFLLEMKRDLKEGYDISMLDIIDKFDETFEEE